MAAPDLEDHEGRSTQDNSSTITQTIDDVETCMMSSKISHLIKNLLRAKYQTLVHANQFFTPNGPNLLIFLAHHSILSAHIDGTITERGLEKALEKFFNNTECEVLISSIAAAGTGLNITCTNIVYLMVRRPPEFDPNFPTLTSTFPGGKLKPSH
ncbi:hypothetical protein O181_125623 [Austropuccinia psidii MF-1]|uniref:Helicase C-terminal domain-containing protein n=1 Tax=Austropuccinia psidii MF-1 TaxID=1389203 RepID=A0A9Q3KQY6_9BASI|nr:hypothetical protein [Austropuccinia psidii MF-1]